MDSELIDRIYRTYAAVGAVGGVNLERAKVTNTDAITEFVLTLKVISPKLSYPTLHPCTLHLV